MANDFVITIRKAEAGNFGGDAGPSKMLLVPPGAQTPKPEHEVSRKDWMEGLLDSFAETNGVRSGRVLAYVHGYNNSAQEVLARHRLMQVALANAGWTGTMLSFDWPSETNTMKYLEDRREVRAVSDRLVTDLILPFVKYRDTGCEVDVNLLAHSMGAYLVREAFVSAEDNRRVSEANWSIGQVAFVGGDVSSSCFEADSSDAHCFERHCARFTNYYTPQDSALKVSDVKRIGLAPRVGRVGLPKSSSSRFVDVDCSERFVGLEEDAWERRGGSGTFSHSWYFGDEVFARDLACTLLGDIDRNYFPTRRSKADDDLVLNPR